MSTIRLNSWAACRESWTNLCHQPWLLLGFSFASFSTHLLSWGLFAAAEQVDSGVLAALLHLIGIGVYIGSLLWMIEGFTLAGLAIANKQTLTWRELSPAACRHSWRLCLCVVNLSGALLITAVVTGVFWSLLVLLLPSLSMVPALLGLIGAAAVLMSQLFGPCLVLDTRLKATAVFREGVWLLEHHSPGLLLLSSCLFCLLLLPILVGLLAEALIRGLGVVATAMALVVALPLATTTVTAAYVQLRPELISNAALKRSGH